MDQDSFRKLLQTPAPNGQSSSRTPTGSLHPAPDKSTSKPKPPPSFKPRKVKKPTGSAGGRYRDRATERRAGVAGDFAEVEAVLEDFERRAAQIEDKDEVEQQRKYLGGDKDHTVLVKGLDLALLEQNRARLAVQEGDADDDDLERAFLEAKAGAVVSESGDGNGSGRPRKRTREELVRELKAGRRNGDEAGGEEAGVQAATKEEEARLLEEAKRAGKFKPIGFKPIGASTEKAKKKSKKDGEKGGDERKKKRNKVEGADGKESGGRAQKKSGEDGPLPPAPAPPSPALPAKVPEPEPEPIDEDFDIFAGAGEYDGFVHDSDDSDLDDGDGDPQLKIETKTKTKEKEREREREEGEDSDDPALNGQLKPSRWFADDTEPTPPIQPQSQPRSPQAAPGPTNSEALRARTPAHDSDAEPEPEMTRLVPLASSALPSIRDFLAMDEAGQRKGKGGKGKRKGKRKGGGEEEEEEGGKEKMSVEGKVERDYKRLKSYTEKKEKAAGGK